MKLFIFQKEFIPANTGCGNIGKMPGQAICPLRLPGFNAALQTQKAVICHRIAHVANTKYYPNTVNIKQWLPCMPVCVILSATACATQQQPHHVGSMLVQCWASVADAGPTFDQHRVNASCLRSMNNCGRRPITHLYISFNAQKTHYINSAVFL